jgi:hypothetical protein
MAKGCSVASVIARKTGLPALCHVLMWWPRM